MGFAAREPIERGKVLLMRLLAKAPVGLQVNDHIVEPGDVVFGHACQLGFEGIVSKRLGSPYRSGRSRHWVKSKKPQASGGEARREEDWGRRRCSPDAFRDQHDLARGAFADLPSCFARRAASVSNDRAILSISSCHAVLSLGSTSFGTSPQYLDIPSLSASLAPFG